MQQKPSFNTTIRWNQAEYQELQRKAKGQPLATYIKALIRAAKGK